LQGVTPEDAGNHIQPGQDEWGFATRLPSARALLAEAEAGRASDLLARLRASRTFGSPDCVDAMAEALHVAEVVEGLLARCRRPQPRLASSNSASRSLASPVALLLMRPAAATLQCCLGGACSRAARQSSARRRWAVWRRLA